MNIILNNVKAFTCSLLLLWLCPSVSDSLFAQGSKTRDNNAKGDSPEVFQIDYYTYRSPPYSSLKQMFEYEKKVSAIRYTCEEEFLISMLALPFVEADLELGNKTKSEIKKVRSKISKELSKINDKLQSALSSQKGKTARKQIAEEYKQQVEEFRSQIKTDFNRLLTSRQEKRLRQLRNRLAVRTLGLKEVLNSLLNVCKEDSRVTELIVQRYQEYKPDISDFCLTLPAKINKQVKDRSFRKGLLLAWMGDVLDEAKAISLKRTYDELGHGYFPDLLYGELQNLEASPLKDKKIDLDFLWSHTSEFKAYPDLRYKRNIFHEKDESGLLNFAKNLALSPSYQTFFELSSDQKTDLRRLYSEFRLKPESLSRDELEKLMVPGQINMIESRCAWREVELYGIAAALVHGRLGNELGLSRKKKAELQSNAKRVLAKYDGLLVARDKVMYRLIHEFLKTHDFEVLYDIAFGENIESWHGKNNDDTEKRNTTKTD